MMCYNTHKKRVGGSMNGKIKSLGCMAILTFLSFNGIVNAESSCDYETQVKLRQEATNVKANYEVGWYGSGVMEPAEFPSEDSPGEFEIKEPLVKNAIYNITENLYVEITNKNTDSTEVYYFRDTDNGTIEWETDVEDIINYEIKIFSNHPDCPGEEIYKIPLTTPKYNKHHPMTYCNNNNEYYCKEFITQEINMSSEEVHQMALEDELKRTKEIKEEEEKKESFWQKYKIYFIVVGVLALLGVLITVILRIWKRSKTI